MAHRLLLLGCVGLSLACQSSETKRAASSPRAAFDKLSEACRNRNVEHLWAASTSTAEFRQSLESLAADISRNFSEEELQELHPPFRGTRADFTGLAYLTALMAKDDRAMNPCFGASEWQLTEALSEGGRHTFLVARPDGYDIALRFALQGEHWRLHSFSKPIKREQQQQPRASRPCSWSGHYHFELSWPKQPACELGTLPQQIDVYVEADKEGAPRLLPLGKYLPTDMLEGPRCELEFDGAPSGLPEGRRLKLEFEERGSDVQASGRYFRFEVPEGDMTAGCSVLLTVKASKEPNP